jgi:hypothetical protein
MPTYPGQTTATQLTVDALLRQPRLISRDLVSLTSKRFVADRILQRGTSEMVAGGAMQYQRDESIYVTNDPEESIAPALWPRTTWVEEVRTAAVKEYGLEVPILYTSIRRNNRPQLTMAERKLSNNIVRFVDKLMFTTLEADTDVQTFGSGAVWTTAGTDIIAEIAKAQELIELQDNGYSGFENAVLVLHTNLRDALLNNTVLRAALPRETTDGQIRTGMMAPFLGLREILFSSQITATLAFVVDTSVAGVIADEAPAAEEGFSSYNPPGSTQSPIYTKVYDEPEGRRKIVSGGRWPAIALVAPKAVVKITAVA